MRKIASPASPKTPVKAGETGSSVSTSGRKEHQCIHCGQPRKGHQRSGCSNVYPKIPPSTPPTSRGQVVEISGLLENLAISSKTAPGPTESDTDAKERRRRRSSAPLQVERSDTLASLSTTTSEVLGQLSHPGSMAPLSDDETEKEEIKPGLHSTPIKQKQNTRPPRPLKRSPTEEDMDDFLNDLKDRSKVHPACGFLLDVEDLKAMRARFTRVKGLEVRVLTSTRDPDAYVVVGLDKRAVDVLFDRMRDEAKKGGGVRSLLSAGGVGVAAGAFATFAGLAYL